jgi:hypothetical protein
MTSFRDHHNNDRPKRSSRRSPFHAPARDRQLHGRIPPAQVILPIRRTVNYRVARSSGSPNGYDHARLVNTKVIAARSIGGRLESTSPHSLSVPDETGLQRRCHANWQVASPIRLGPRRTGHPVVNTRRKSLSRGEIAIRSGSPRLEGASPTSYGYWCGFRQRPANNLVGIEAIAIYYREPEAKVEILGESLESGLPTMEPGTTWTEKIGDESEAK